jgi:hypothetical protein
MADQNTQTMNTSQLALNKRASNAPSGQHTKQYVQGSVNQYAHQSSEHQHVPSSLYAEEHRGMNLEESMIDDKYNMSFDESRNIVCSQNISALESAPIMHALPNLSKRDPTALGPSRQSNFVNSQVRSLNTTCDNIQGRNKKKIESKYNFLNVNQTMVIPENSRVERRLAKLSNNFKKHSLDGKFF